MFKKQQDRDIVEEKLSQCDGRIKKYVKGRLLGKVGIYLIQGGFAKCYQFTSQETGRRYAAKVIDKQSLNKAQARQKLQSQIKIHKSLQHLHIVRFEHFFQDHQYVYILLEICPNQTLNELLKRRKRLTQVQVKYYVYQIVLALQYLHSQRVIHRDLKVGNLFLSDRLEIKLGDFGLAAIIVREGERRKTVCGTPNYIAPEILQSKKGHSYEVDIWSLGVITYALLFGKPPFETNDVNLTYSKIKQCNYSFPQFAHDVSDIAKKFVVKMLQLDPMKRATLDQLLEHEFLAKNELPKSLPRSTLACPPNKNFFQQLKQASLAQPQRFGFQAVKMNEFDSNCLVLNSSNNAKLIRSSHKHQANKITSKSKQLQTNAIGRTLSSNNLLSRKKLSCQQLPEMKCLLPKTWINYFQDNPKFGMCYLLNTNALGMRYNDMSCMIANNKFTRFKYVTLHPNLRESTIQTFEGVNFPQTLHKKLKIINHYHKQLRQKMKQDSIHPLSSKTFRQQKQTENEALTCYVNRYHSSTQASIFWFNTKNIQVIFKDQSQLQITKTHIGYVDKGGQRCLFKSELADQQSQEIRSRLKYLSEVLKKIKQLKKDSDVGEKTEKENQVPRSNSVTHFLSRQNKKNYSSTHKLTQNVGQRAQSTHQRPGSQSRTGQFKSVEQMQLRMSQLPNK